LIGFAMLKQIEIENIEEMRRQQGIDDVELAEAIRRLKVGDVVRLTFLTRVHSFETTPVRITRISGIAFCGIVQSTSRVRRGKVVEFTIAHIHSVAASSVKHKSKSVRPS
jgi:hypothetical protein